MKARLSKSLLSLLLPAILAIYPVLGVAGGNTSACADAGLDAKEMGLCRAYCDVLDCAQADPATATQCEVLKGDYLALTGDVPPCEQKTCSLIDPALLFERISKIPNPEYVCYSDDNAPPYTYVEYIVRSEGVPQIGLGMEDTFDGFWYGYYFEYQDGADGALPEFYRYDLIAEDVQTCRKAFEPPFDCSF